MSTIHLYAEHLQNIHTVSFTAILASYHTDETSAELSADGEYISLTHEGERASIRLPVRIKGGGSATLALPKSPAKELTLRLQLEEKDGMRLLQDILTNDRENLVPWNASELERWKGVSCKNCGNLVAGHDGVRSESEVVADTKDGSITSWRDLPNENWAEMMDFWHCHKPEHQHHALAHSSDKDGNGKLESESVLTKGYAANNKLCASKGVGYVGLGFLLFAEEDCGGIEICPSSQRKPHLKCKICQENLGYFEEQTNGMKIWKWNISSTLLPGSPRVTGSSLECWISAHFLDLVENHGVRKFRVTSEKSCHEKNACPTEGMMLWIFTPSLSFSSSVDSAPEDGKRADPTRAMKLFWKRVSGDADEKDESSGGVEQGVTLKQESLSVEDVALPSRLYVNLHKSLENNARIMPQNARSFQGWNVSLLQRFTRVSDVASRVDITSALLE